MWSLEITVKYFNGLTPQEIVRSFEAFDMYYIPSSAIGRNRNKSEICTFGRSHRVGSKHTALEIKMGTAEKHVTNIFENKHQKIRKHKVQKVTFKSVKTIKSSLIIIRKTSM